MITIDIAPLSVNKCWAGRRFKTPTYKSYETELLLKLPAMKLPSPPYSIKIILGVSNAMSDIDNPVKPFLDILQKKYNFNDRLIIEIHSYKHKIEKGKEFIKFLIETSAPEVIQHLAWKSAKQ